MYSPPQCAASRRRNDPSGRGALADLVHDQQAQATGIHSRVGARHFADQAHAPGSTSQMTDSSASAPAASASTAINGRSGREVNLGAADYRSSRPHIPRGSPSSSSNTSTSR